MNPKNKFQTIACVAIVLTQMLTLEGATAKEHKGVSAARQNQGKTHKSNPSRLKQPVKYDGSGCNPNEGTCDDRARSDRSRVETEERERRSEGHD